MDRLRRVPFSRRSFMHSFYIQCYYFSPVTLSFWSLLLGFAYFIDPNKEALLLFLPAITVLILLIWLFINETRLVMKEKNISVIPGVLFTGVCYTLISLLLYIYIKFTQNPEIFRKLLWGFYGIAIVGFIVVAASRSLIKMLRKLF
jgi:NADH:ubiquinone oxidoreductase subunit 2 (subunit N)